MLSGKNNKMVNYINKNIMEDRRCKFFTVVLITLSVVLFYSTAIHAATTEAATTKLPVLKKIRFNGNPPQMVMDISGRRSPEVIKSYDETNRILFLQLVGIKKSSSIRENRLINGNYVKKIQTVAYEGAAGVFIYLQKNVDYEYKKLKNPNRLVIDFHKKRLNKEYTIILDAGHGGRDAGAIGFRRYKEKDIVFSVTKYLRDILKNDFNIVMTRTTDKFVELGERADIGNRNDGDLFVSIHANSVRSRKARGFEVFYYSKTSSPYAAKVAAFENSFGKKYGKETSAIAKVKGETEYKLNKARSLDLATKLTKSYPRRLNMLNRGTHGANFSVLRGFDGPGILVELGFLSNYTELKKLRSKVNQKRMAREIAKAIKTYFYD